MGFVPGHTSHAVQGRTVGDVARRDADTARCALAGNSFHSLSVAVILGCQFAKLGIRSVYASPKTLQKRFFEELATHSQKAEAHMATMMEAASLIVDPSSIIEGYALRAKEAIEAYGHHSDV
jgi:hypothetical protein